MKVYNPLYPKQSPISLLMYSIYYGGGVVVYHPVPNESVWHPSFGVLPGEDLVISPTCEVGVTGSIPKKTNWKMVLRYLFMVSQPNLRALEQSWCGQNNPWNHLRTLS